MENKIPTTITGIFYILERVTGIEPVSLDWQPSVIATIRYPLISL
ncbi:MAG: hypothetical protein UR78_C0003G0006 [Candidatus Moranbacteria bacterium GW2011_GWF2_35_39]|nr:MAG: hypothetical protein UR78_C0003G0006 [Candidatus Moranbacteria bacterium GW2011_GWF2_35_39]